MRFSPTYVALLGEGVRWQVPLKHGTWSLASLEQAVSQARTTVAFLMCLLVMCTSEVLGLTYQCS